MLKNEDKRNESGENETVNDKKLTEQDLIEESGGVVAKNKDETIHCLSIIGQIEGQRNTSIFCQCWCPLSRMRRSTAY